MKVPDKLFIKPGQIKVEMIPGGELPNVGIQYIRKDALLEWLEQNRNQAQMWFDRYGDRLDGAAKQVWEEVIGKLNEM